MRMNESSTDFQRKLFRAARERGWDPSALTEQQYNALKLEIRTVIEVVRDGTKAVVSRGLTSLNLRVVSDEKAAENERICRENRCGKFRSLTGAQKPACDACNCSSKWLESKWKDKASVCPIVNPETGKPYWNNNG